MPHFTFDISTALGLGRDAAALTFTQISLRGIIVFIATLVIVRCGDRRFLSQKTAFDAVLGFILASMLARAVNGTAAFVPTLGAGFVLVVLHRVLAYWSRRSHAFRLLIKGRSDVIVRDGHVDDPMAKRNRLSEHDLLEDLRLNGNVRHIRDVALAVFERNGQISGNARALRRPLTRDGYRPVSADVRARSRGGRREVGARVVRDGRPHHILGQDQESPLLTSGRT